MYFVSLSTAKAHLIDILKNYLFITSCWCWSARVSLAVPELDINQVQLLPSHTVEKKQRWCFVFLMQFFVKFSYLLLFNVFSHVGKWKKYKITHQCTCIFFSVWFFWSFLPRGKNSLEEKCTLHGKCLLCLLLWVESNTLLPPILLFILNSFSFSFFVSGGIRISSLCWTLRLKLEFL